MIDTIKQSLTKLLDTLGIEYEDVIIEQSADNEYYANIVSEKDSNVLIGWHGKTLFALQSMLRILMSSDDIRDINVVVDVENYRKKQEQNVLELAERKALRARETGEEQFMAPMHPYYRKRIHELFADNPNYEDISTESVGEGRDRQVKIIIK